MGTVFEVQGPGAKLWMTEEYCPPDNVVLNRQSLMQGYKSLYYGIPRRECRRGQTDDGAGREDLSVDGGGRIKACIIVVREGDLV